MSGGGPLAEAGAEIGRLRAEIERLRTAAEAERAAVVAWLRKPCGAHYFADAIERGEHRAGEVKR